MSITANVYAKARSEIIALFGWNADDSLSPDQTLRLDCAVALRLALDDLQGRIVRGESIDVGRMLTSAEALAKLLPPAVLASPPPAANAPDARQIMWETYLGMRKRGELFDPCSTHEGRIAEVDRLKARVAELEAALAGRAPGESTVPPLPENVVSLRNDNPRPPAAPSKPAPAAPVQRGLLTDNVDEPWRAYLNASYDPWADNRR
jgi:hypothetical protein